MDRPKVEIEKPGKGFSRVHVTFLNVGEDARPTIRNCAARMRRAASLAHGDPPQGVDPGVLDYEADVLERLADRLAPGDIAALRGALKRVLAAYESGAIHTCAECYRDEWDDELGDLKAAVEAALSAPPRNCDNYETPDEAWCEYAKTHRGTSDRSWKSLILFARWLFAPAGGAK